MRDDLLLPQPHAPIRVQIAESRSEYSAAFELVYRLYLAKGYTRPHPGGVVYHRAFGLSSTRTLVAVNSEGRVVGTLSVVGDSPAGLLLESTYPEEVRSLRGEGRFLAEIAALGVNPDAGGRPREVFFSLTEFMIHYAYWRRFDDLVMAIHPRHYRMYWQCFRAAPMGPCREYEQVCRNPAIACRIDLHTLRQNVDSSLWERYFSRVYADQCFAAPPMRQADHIHFCRRRGIAVGPAFSECDRRPARAG
jgi:hypothetical protein